QFYARAWESASGPRPAFVYKRLSRVLITEPSRVRPGRDSKGAVYVAQPELVDGSIRYRPKPLNPRGGVAPSAMPSTPAALRTARDSLRPLLIEWVNSAP